MSKVNFKFKEYNKKNWYTGVVHACQPKWKEWVDVPENLQNVYYSQHTFYKTLCGADKVAGSFALTSRSKVTCMTCLKILGEEIDKEKLTRRTFHMWYGTDRSGWEDVFGKYKRAEIRK